MGGGPRGALVGLKPARIAGALLVVVGAILGTFTDSQNAPPAVRAGDYWILSGDFHVHAFPGDGGLPVWELRREAARRGLHAIAITNHNHFAAARLAPGAFSNREAPFVLRGQEVTARTYHIAAVGLERPVNARQSATRAIAAVQAQGGAAIAAHPGRDFWAGFDTTALRVLDGTELAHPEAEEKPEFAREFADFHELSRALNPDVSAIGSSDFHFAAPLGLCRTFLLTTEASPGGVLAALKAGRTVALDSRGELLGDPLWVALVRPHVPALLPDGRMSTFQTLSVVAVLLGFFLLIATGSTGKT
jgi:predicted metal-dependent phosphoesterase TrpH